MSSSKKASNFGPNLVQIITPTFSLFVLIFSISKSICLFLLFDQLFYSNFAHGMF